jgi:hypothetical protein
VITPDALWLVNQPIAVVGEPADALQRPQHEELAGERRDRQVEALDAQRRQAEGDADRRRAEPGQREGDQRGQPRRPQLEVVRHERAHRHERRRAERELPGVAGEDVEPECSEREDQERRQDGRQPVLVGEQRHRDEGDREQDRHRDPVLPDRKHLLVGGVGGLELAGFAIDHG